jgi:hypothetical protein
MERCVQSAAVNSPCLMCGGRAEKMHRPMFHRGSFCPRCCPVCAVAAVPAAANVATDVPLPRPATPLAQGRSQWADDGWGPRRDANGQCIDPWYRDSRPLREPERWVPRREWF